MSERNALSPDARLDPYWWRAAPLRETPLQDLPAKCDVAIVGSGFTGLSAALHLARDVRSVAVLEAKEPGWGASTRNFGFVGLLIAIPAAAAVGVLVRYGISRYLASPIYRGEGGSGET